MNVEERRIIVVKNPSFPENGNKSESAKRGGKWMIKIRGKERKIHSFNKFFPVKINLEYYIVLADFNEILDANERDCFTIINN